MSRRIAFKQANNDKEQMRDTAGADSMTPVVPMSDVFELARLLIKKRKLIVTFTLGVALATTSVLFLIPNRFESRATILPSGQTDKFSELKNLTGLGMAAADENSSEIFPSIIESDLVKSALMDKTFSFKEAGAVKTLTLSEYFDEDNPDKLSARLDKITSVNRNKKTGIITLTAETKYAGLSQEILKTYLTELENFNLHKRRSRGKENAGYLSRQVEQKIQKLSAAEKELEEFRSLNRNWASSSNPMILSNLGRLERDVQVATGVYLYLTKELEAAKLDAQKDVPIVRILDRPSLPTIKSGPKRLLTTAVGTLMAFLIILFLITISHIIKRQTAGAEQVSYQACRDDFTEAFPWASRLISRTKESETV